MTVFPKVQTVTNQVFKINGVCKNKIVKLTSLVDEDNIDGCDEYYCNLLLIMLTIQLVS